MKIIAAALMCLMFGCASLSYGKRQTDNTRRLMVGMNPEQVEITLGEPNTVSANGTGTLWYYELLKNGEMFEQVVPFYVTFQNGVVTNFGASGAVRDGRREQMQAVHDAANELSESVKPAPVRPLIQPIQCRTRPDGFGGATTNCGP